MPENSNVKSMKFVHFYRELCTCNDEFLNNILFGSILEEQMEGKIDLNKRVLHKLERNVQNLR